jgi:multiple sugar transport system permease protein
MESMDVTATEVTVRAPRRRWISAEGGLGIVLAMPILLVMALLVFFPVFVTLWDSMRRIDPMRAGTPFIGLANYFKLFADQNVRTSALNTLVYVAVTVILETVFGVLVALMLNRVKRGRKWLLAAILLPWALPPVVNALVWSWIFNPSHGVLNGLLMDWGLITSRHVWMNDRVIAWLFISVVHVWRMMPLTAVIILAALQGIPAELYEAAEMDGAGSWRKFRSITLPLIAGALAIALSQSTVFAFNLFDEAWILGGASVDTRTVLIQVYQSAFQDMHFSYGMSLSVLVMLASLAVSLVYVLKVHRETRFD